MNSARWTFFQLHLSLNGCQYNHSGTQWKFGHEQVLNGGELCGHWVGMCGRLNICVSVFLFKMGFNVAMMQRAKRNPLSVSFLHLATQACQLSSSNSYLDWQTESRLVQSHPLNPPGDTTLEMARVPFQELVHSKRTESRHPQYRRSLMTIR